MLSKASRKQRILYFLIISSLMRFLECLKLNGSGMISQ